jgi:hypothetical protein
MDLQGAYTLLTTQHKIDDLKPSLQGIIGILEDRTHQHRKAIPLRGATALPMPSSAKFIDFIATAAWAPYAIGPAPGSQIAFTGILSRKSGFQFRESHLIGFRNFHNNSPLNLDGSKDNTFLGLCQEVDNRL